MSGDGYSPAHINVLLDLCRHAIWRFKEENKALMKRMYGDVESSEVYRKDNTALFRRFWNKWETMQAAVAAVGIRIQAVVAAAGIWIQAAVAAAGIRIQALVAAAGIPIKLSSGCGCRDSNPSSCRGAGIRFLPPTHATLYLKKKGCIQVSGKFYKIIVENSTWCIPFW